MADCLIIMPISMPVERVKDYGGDANHFRHVLEDLFLPAVKKADLNPIPPVTKAADLIHAEVVSNLETADLVLCDMSTHDAKVFFELGIRTSLDKPICLVKDSLTTKVPFDTALLNCHTYDASIAARILDSEIDRLAQHLTSSQAKCQGQNPLWKHFGLTAKAEGREAESPIEEKLDLVIESLERLERTDVFFGLSKDPAAHIDPIAYLAHGVVRRAHEIIRREGLQLDNSFLQGSGGRVRLTLLVSGGDLSEDGMERVQEMADLTGLAVHVGSQKMKDDSSSGR